MINPAWWLFYKTGETLLKGLEKTGELIDQMEPDEREERDEEDEEQRKDENDDESPEDSQEDDHEEGWSQENQDVWDKENGLRVRDQSWWHDDDEEEPEEIAESEESSEDEPEEDDDDEAPLGEKAANWAARKFDRGMSRLAMAGLRRIVNTDWSEDDKPKEAGEPRDENETEKHEREIHEFWENYDEDRPIRAYESVNDLIHGPEEEPKDEEEDDDGCGDDGQ